jgi:hypothetical protein
MSFDPKTGGRGPDSKTEPGWEERLHEAGSRMEEELRRVIAYINDEVVPEVRRNGSDALRVAAQQMEKLAQKMDERSRRNRAPGEDVPPPPPPPHVPRDEAK